MAKKNIKGHEGLLLVWDTAAYKPLVCLTSTSMDRAAEMVEKVSYCTQGEKHSSVNSITRSLSLDGEVVEIEGEDNAVTYVDFVNMMESMEEKRFKIEGRGEATYFKGVIASLSDTFAAGEDATFSGSININSKPTSTDPNE